MRQNLIINVEPVIRKALNLTGKRVIDIEDYEGDFEELF